MGIDKNFQKQHNRGPVASNPVRTPEVSFRDTVGELSALIVDLDHVGLQGCLQLLAEASEDCLFVLWLPRRYAPSEVSGIHHALVDHGATLLERSSSGENAGECWARVKEALLERKYRREHGVTTRVGKSLSA